ncbi:hypothetical protein ACA910_022041 [Epithemia clementina (nom. ined.)]
MQRQNDSAFSASLKPSNMLLNGQRKLSDFCPAPTPSSHDAAKRTIPLLSLLENEELSRCYHVQRTRLLLPDRQQQRRCFSSQVPSENQQHRHASSVSTHEQQSQHQDRSDQNQNRDVGQLRCTILAMGENWTGAFGTGKLDQVVRGHYDEKEEVPAPLTVFEGTLAAPGSSFGVNGADRGPADDLPSVSAGWGHSAICAGDQLLLAGQPHDWFKLLRYKRLPPFLAQFVTKFEAIPKTTIGQALSRIMRQKNENTQLEKSLLPVPLQNENVPMQIQLEDHTRDHWHLAEHFSFMYEWTNMPLPEPPLKVLCTAGLTAVLGVSGRLYSFGQNHWGQCGTGMITDSNVWVPQHPVVKSIADDVVDDFHLRLGAGGFENTMLPEVKPEEAYEDEEQFDVLFLKDFALGLQHGVGVDAAGRVYCWGKAKNGQLGQHRIWDDSAAALRVAQYFTIPDFESRAKPTYHTLEPVRQVAAGMLHCAALSVDNNVYVWGKNVLPPLPKQKERGKKSSDGKIPYRIPRHTLPDREIVQIACGSHHTAMLFDDGSVYAVGVSTDTRIPIGLDPDNGLPPVQLIPPGHLDGGVRYFSADMDRTTVIDGSGRNLLQAHLWQDPEFQRQAMFTPSWVKSLFEEQPHAVIEQVHRSWVHSLVVTTTPSSSYQEPATTATASATSAEPATKYQEEPSPSSAEPGTNNASMANDTEASPPQSVPGEPSRRSEDKP